MLGWSWQKSIVNLRLIIRSGERALSVLTIEVEAGHIQTIRVVANPDKLAHV